VQRGELPSGRRTVRFEIVNAATAEILEKAKALPAEELRELCAELMRQATGAALARPTDTQVAGKKLWDAEEHKAWLRQTWGTRYFTAEEVREMKDAEDGVTD
jgi:hypothetical protein